jgi:hypothetical protein
MAHLHKESNAMLRVELPEELADELVADGLAVRPGQRGSVAEILIDAAVSTATAVSLLQTPDTFIRLAELIKKLFVKKSESVRMTIKGKEGKIDIEVTRDKDLETLARLIQEGLVGKVK